MAESLTFAKPDLLKVPSSFRNLFSRSCSISPIHRICSNETGARRGLDILNKIQKELDVKVLIYEGDLEDGGGGQQARKAG